MKSSFSERFPHLAYILGLTSDAPDPTPIFEKPSEYTNDLIKIQKINLLKKQYDQELWHARYKASTKSGLLGSIPSVGLAFGAGSVRSYITDRLAEILNAKKSIKLPKFVKPLVQFYERYPHGTKLTLGIGLPLIGATLGAGLGIILKPHLYNIEYQTELNKLNNKYFEKLKTIL